VKIDSDTHKVMHSVLTLKLGVTFGCPSDFINVFLLEFFLFMSDFFQVLNFLFISIFFSGATEK
jgi:hypothetical protein